MPLLSSLSSLSLHLLADSWCKRYAVILIFNLFESQKTPTACKLLISGSISLPFSGFFSPFPRGTCSLSVRITYSEIRGWYPDVRWIITSPTDFWIIHPFFLSILQDYHLLWPLFHQISNRFWKKHFSLFSLSLATTYEISFDFFSSSY